MSAVLGYRLTFLWTKPSWMGAYLARSDALDLFEAKDPPPRPLQLLPEDLANVTPDLNVCSTSWVESYGASSPSVVCLVVDAQAQSDVSAAPTALVVVMSRLFVGSRIASWTAVVPL